MRTATAFFVASATAVGASTDAASRLNVYGSDLQSCSTDGTALTGYTRTGMCVDQNDDAGSHHICIDLSSITDGNDDDGGGDNFCSVTGQSDWCSSEEMPCHEDSSDASCSIQNWCVCQWAFASYIDAAGGCDAIQEVVCESINLQAVWAYQKISNQVKYANALACLVERCEIDVSTLPSSPSSRIFGVGETLQLLAAVLPVLGAVGGYFLWKKKMGASVKNQAENDHYETMADAGTIS